MSAAINACFSFLWTLYVCHNYKKRLYNRNVLLRVKCLITLRLIPAFFFFFWARSWYLTILQTLKRNSNSFTAWRWANIKLFTEYQIRIITLSANRIEYSHFNAYKASENSYKIWGFRTLHAYVFAYKNSRTKNAADIAMKKYELQTYWKHRLSDQFCASRHWTWVLVRQAMSCWTRYLSLSIVKR